MKKILFLAFFLSFPILSSAWADWEVVTVDSDPYTVGVNSSLALDSNDYPHISYQYSTSSDLRYAKWNGTSWSTSTITSAGSVGYDSSIAIDSSNNLHISYYDLTNKDLKYAKWTGSSWSLDTVDSAGEVGTWTSIALDTNNYPHISYTDYSNHDLKYAKWNGTSWSTYTVDSAGWTGDYTSIALDTSNYAHIAYRNGSAELKYAKWNGASWTIETIDLAGMVCGGWGGISLALDTNNNAHISCKKMSASRLMYVKWDGVSWSTATVDLNGDCPSIKLDTSNHPHVSYYTNNCLKYAQWNGISWSTSTVDFAGNIGTGEWTSLALDTSGYAHISYYDNANTNLKYAVWKSTSAPAPTYYIKGYVKTAGSVAISAVTMTLTGSGPGSGVTTTDSNGYYEFLGLGAGNYTVTPSKNGYSFSLPANSYSPLNSNQNNQDFTGTPPSTFYIKGYIKVSSSTAISNVTVALSGSVTASTSTDSNGYYEFTGLGNGSYTVTPTKTGYVFNPSSNTYPSLSGYQDNQDFTGIPLYFIIGYVTRYGGTPISAVTMTLSGAGSAVTTTDDNGYYDFTGLVESSYTVTPSKTGYTFGPPNNSYSPLNSNQYDQNFIGNPPSVTYYIKGYIKTSSSAAISAVTVVLSGSDTGSTSTDSSGYYEFLGLSVGAYTVTPSKTGYSFNPSSNTYLLLNSNKDNQDFTGTPAVATHYIKGSVKDSNGTGMQGVTVSLTGEITGSTLTATDGSYQFLDLTAGKSYTITPSKTGWTFTQANINIPSLNSDADNQNFTGILSSQQQTEADTVKPAEFHFGYTPAVKKKLKELKEKVDREAKK